MSIPHETGLVPARVRHLAGDAEGRAVWLNERGGTTYRAGDVHIKFGPLNAEESMADEAERLTWAGRFIRVPEVVAHGIDEDFEWLVTRTIAAQSAVAPGWIARPAIAAHAVGAGLRMLHDSLPVAECPWRWDVEQRRADAAGRGIRLDPGFEQAPAVDRLVVCHGDACVPNTLLADTGDPTAHVDLGRLGVGDRWADIAVAAMSTEWNFGPGWEWAVLEGYGIKPDAARMDFYRDLWNAT
ncbi:Aminoglycoside phosphotransferase [Microbacterium sp. C448]|uniref:aminoglycoside 3'-phosphotransferase n=1 Tax=Microbacterium TaxID=33882 RepID=UPI0003DE0AD6|nr:MULTISPECIES: aminoglycoside 3'-phosphotransferase [Microbacterium]CDJ99893.1 Aminoglycoside phosphotransferase [Microbacterium sp. C448]